MKKLLVNSIIFVALLATMFIMCGFKGTGSTCESTILTEYSFEVDADCKYENEEQVEIETEIETVSESESETESTTPEEPTVIEKQYSTFVVKVPEGEAYTIPFLFTGTISEERYKDLSVSATVYDSLDECVLEAKTTNVVDLTSTTKMLLSGPALTVGQEKVVTINMFVSSKGSSSTIELSESSYRVRVIGVEKKEEPTTVEETTTASEEEIVDPNQVNTKIKKITARKKALKIKLKRIKTVKGYQVHVATDKKFKKITKKVTTKSNKRVNLTIKKLKAKTKYFVRVRTYKVDNGLKVYSKWSKAKAKKTKIVKAKKSKKAKKVKKNK